MKYISKYGNLNPKQKCSLLGWTFNYMPEKRRITITDNASGKQLFIFSASFSYHLSSRRDEIDKLLDARIDKHCCIGYQLNGWSKLVEPGKRNNSNRSDGTMMTTESKIREFAKDRDFFIDRITKIEGVKLRTLLFHEHNHELDQAGFVMPSKVLLSYLEN